jgi:hypothetical protein
MRKIDGFIISVVGLGFVVGSLASKLGFVTTLMVGIGLGFMVGGVFKEIRGIKNKTDK